MSEPVLRKPAFLDYRYGACSLISLDSCAFKLFFPKPVLKTSSESVFEIFYTDHGFPCPFQIVLPIYIYTRIQKEYSLRLRCRGVAQGDASDLHFT